VASLLSSADAVVLCAKKSGKVIVRDDVCKSRETAVLPGADTSQGCVAITPRGGCCRSSVTTGAFANATAATTLAVLGIVPPLHAVLQ